VHNNIEKVSGLVVGVYVWFDVVCVFEPCTGLFFYFFSLFFLVGSTKLFLN